MNLQYAGTGVEMDHRRLRRTQEGPEPTLHWVADFPGELMPPLGPAEPLDFELGKECREQLEWCMDAGA